MAEPDNSDTVTEQETEQTDTTERTEDAEQTADDVTVPAAPTPVKRPSAPVKASPLQKSFLERRKAKEAGAKPQAVKSSAAAKATVSVSKEARSTSKPTSVRRAAADRGRVKQIGTRLLAVVVLIAALAATVLFGIGKYRIDQLNERRAEYAAFAEQVTVNLTTLTPANVDRLQKTLLEQTSGYAKQQMEQAVGQTVELVKQGQMSTKTTVLSTAVTRADADRGSAIMVFGWTSTPKDPKQEMAVETYRWRVDMTRINGQLKLTNFEWVW